MNVILCDQHILEFILDKGIFLISKYNIVWLPIFWPFPVKYPASYDVTCIQSCSLIFSTDVVFVVVDVKTPHNLFENNELNL